jgi:mannose-6-phosphate isomerase-like protein (cupin superfamily)
MHSDVETQRLPLLEFLPPEIDGYLSLADLKFDVPGVNVPPFGVARFSVPAGKTAPVDSHQSHEIWIVTEGEGELLYDSRITKLCKESACFIEAPKSHQLRNTGSRTLEAISIWWR